MWNFSVVIGFNLTWHDNNMIMQVIRSTKIGRTFQGLVCSAEEQWQRYWMLVLIRRNSLINIIRLWTLLFILIYNISLFFARMYHLLLSANCYVCSISLLWWIYKNRFVTLSRKRNAHLYYLEQMYSSLTLTSFRGWLQLTIKFCFYWFFFNSSYRNFYTVQVTLYNFYTVEERKEYTSKYNLFQKFITISLKQFRMSSKTISIYCYGL